MRQYNIDIFLNSTGGPTLKAYLDLVQEKKILVLFPFTGGSFFHTPELTNIIHFRPSYFDEGYLLTKYAREELRGRNIAFFYQSDIPGLNNLPSGIDGAEAFRLGKKDVKFTKIPYTRNTTSFKKQGEMIQKMRPDVLIFFSTSIAAEELIRQVGVDVLSNMRLIGMSDLGESSFGDFIYNRGLKFSIVNVVPNPYTSNLKIVREFRESAEENNLPIDTFILESYITTSLFVYLVQQIKGAVTKEKIIGAAEQIKDLDFKGLMLNFNSQNRQLSHTLWLDMGEEEWIPIETKQFTMPSKRGNR